MVDYNSNFIKSVEGLHRITGLTPAKRNEERKRRRQLRQENEEEEQQLDESVDEQDMDNLPEEGTENRSDRNPDDTGIDYCA